MPKKTRSNYFLKGAIFIISVVIALTTLLYFMQEKLIFLPTKLSETYEYSFDQSFEEINISTEDGAVLNAIHFKTENPKGVILYFHGNAGDLSRWGTITEYFTQYNYDVLVMDYRTFGKSTGEISETALYADAELFYEYVAKKYKESEIIVYGRSLGTTFAAYVASKNKPKQLILETPFFSLTEVAKKRFPFLPIKKLLKYNFPTKNFISQVSCPTFIFHGTEDNVVAYKSGKKLSKKIEAALLDFTTVDGGEHNNLIEFKEYRDKIKKILK